MPTSSLHVVILSDLSTGLVHVANNCCEIMWPTSLLCLDDTGFLWLSVASGPYAPSTPSSALTSEP